MKNQSINQSINWINVFFLKDLQFFSVWKNSLIVENEKSIYFLIDIFTCFSAFTQHSRLGGRFCVGRRKVIVRISKKSDTGTFLRRLCITVSSRGRMRVMSFSSGELEVRDWRFNALVCTHVFVRHFVFLRACGTYTSHSVRAIMFVRFYSALFCRWRFSSCSLKGALFTTRFLSFVQQWTEEVTAVCQGLERQADTCETDRGGRQVPTREKGSHYSRIRQKKKTGRQIDITRQTDKKDMNFKTK